MRRRLYFILPDVESARAVEQELLLAKVEDRFMHFLAKRDTDLGDLPEASVAEKTDLFHGMQVGLAAGAAVGASAGAILLLSSIGASIDSMVSIAGGAFIGALFGIWVAGMIGSSTPNVKLERFQSDIDEGKVLMMADVPKERVEEIEALIARLYPEAKDHGIEPTIPAFP
jgi:hypothetical protein